MAGEKFIRSLIINQLRFVILEILIINFLIMTWLKKLTFLRIQRNFRSLKTYQKILVLVGGFLLLLFLYIFLALAFISQVEIKLAELERSYREDKFCREECQIERREIKVVLTESLQRHPQSRLTRRIKKYIFSPEVNRDFKLALVDILQEATGSLAPPVYLIDYLERADLDPYVAAKIYSKFAPESLFRDALGGGAENSLNLYFKIIETEQAYPLKVAAVRRISQANQKAGAYTTQQIVKITSWLQAGEIELKLKYHLVMLLGDYHSSFPEETKEALRTVYWSASSSDLVRALAGDLLNRFEPEGGPEGGDWEIPVVSDEEWSDYYSD